MVTYASECFDPMERWQLADLLSWTLIRNHLWQEYVENAN